MKASGRAPRQTQKASRIGFRIEEPGWKSADMALLRRAARMTVVTAQRSGSMTVLLTGDDSLRDLNRQFRGKPKPTNVLSFPSSAQSEDGYLGDIAIALGVAAREADAAKKSLSAHSAHLVVHGVLHLLGYDHEAERDARVMEGLEVAILKRLGVGDPYAVPMVAE
jgi:probable rRNA maturation factor